MTNDRPNNNLHGETLVRYWLEKAQEALESAKSEYKAGRLSFAVNRIYYACFYAVRVNMLPHKHYGWSLSMVRRLYL